MAELTLANVRAGYGETVVLEDVALTLPERGSLAVLGRNGVGKTTLLATVMGHTSFHSGTIGYRGKSVERLPAYERSRLGIGYVPQEREIFPSLTVEENLAVAARPGPWTLERVYDLFPGVARRRSHMGNPSLLLMDEPLEGLAPIIVEGLLKALARLIREESLTVVLVEQHAKQALEVTEQALVLNRGRVSYSGTSAELLADSKKLASLIVAA